MDVYKSFCRIVTFFYDLFVPHYCGSCRRILVNRHVVLCVECYATIQPVVSYLLPESGNMPVKVFAMAAYEGAVQQLIRAKNYGDRISSYELGILMAQRLTVDWTDFDYLVPVPLHWTRYIKRGFNQAEIMAQRIGLTHGIPVKILIKRRKRTAYQAHLDADARFENVKHSFELLSIKDRTIYCGKHLVVIDDLYTTGSTVTALVKELKKLKPRAITVLVAARVL